LKKQKQPGAIGAKHEVRPETRKFTIGVPFHAFLILIIVLFLYATGKGEINGK
jgi:hypothetical protein